MKNLIILLINITGFIITSLIHPSNEYAFVWFIVLLGFTISSLLSLAMVIAAYLRKMDIKYDNYISGREPFPINPSDCPICNRDFDDIYEACDECGYNPYSLDSMVD